MVKQERLKKVGIAFWVPFVSLDLIADLQVVDIPKWYTYRHDATFILNNWTSHTVITRFHFF